MFSSFSSRLGTSRPATAAVLAGGAADGIGGGAGVRGVGGMTGGVSRSDLAVNGCTRLRFEPEVSMRCGEVTTLTLALNPQPSTLILILTSILLFVFHKAVLLNPTPVLRLSTWTRPG